MFRDFSETSKQQTLQLVSEVEKDNNIVDMQSNRWNDYNIWMNKLSLNQCVNDVDVYQKTVFAKNKASKEKIESIFNKVTKIDGTYGTIMGNINTELSEILSYIDTMNFIITPSNGVFSSSAMDNKFKDILEREEKASAQCLKDSLMQNVDGDLVFNAELIKEYLGKDETQLSNEKKRVLIDVYYELLKKVDLSKVLNISNSGSSGGNLDTSKMITNIEVRNSISLVGLSGYDKTYVDIINYMYNQDENGKSFATSLLKVTSGESSFSYLGVEASKKSDAMSSVANLTIYSAKYEDENVSIYLNKLNLEAEAKDNGLHLNEDNLKLLNKANEKINEKLVESKYRTEEKDKYYCNEKQQRLIGDGPTFYDKKSTIYEVNKGISVSNSLYEANINTPGNGNIKVDVGRSEAHAGIRAGMYVMGADKKKDIFSPGVEADIGTSYTMLDIDYNQKLLGNDEFGAEANGEIVVGQCSAEAGLGVTLRDENGAINPQANVNVSAEAIGAKAEGDVTGKLFGGEVKAGGSINYGIGGHANVGLKDGVFKVDIGASAGLGASVNFDVDVAGIATGAAKCASKQMNKCWKNINKIF